MKKLSIWSSYYMDLSPYQMVEQLSKCKVKYSELSDEHGLMLLKEQEDYVETGRKFKEYAKAHNVKFVQGHLWLNVKICHNKEQTLETLKKWILLFEAIGIQTMVLHCDDIYENKDLTYQQRLDCNLEALKPLVDFLKNKKVVICLENLITFCETADSLLYLVNSLNSKNFGICLDTGHLNLAKQNQREFILKCKDKLKALHIADNDGSYDEHIMPFCNGHVNFNEVFTTLNEINYKGLYNYEIPGERNCLLDIRNYKIEYIKKAFKTFLKAIN